MGQSATYPFFGTFCLITIINKSISYFLVQSMMQRNVSWNQQSLKSKFHFNLQIHSLFIKLPRFSNLIVKLFQDYETFSSFLHNFFLLLLFYLSRLLETTDRLYILEQLFTNFNLRQLIIIC